MRAPLKQFSVRENQAEDPDSLCLQCRYCFVPNEEHSTKGRYIEQFYVT